MVVRHNYEKYDNSWIGWNILEGKNIIELTKDGDLFSGTFDEKVWGKGISFTCFIIPLDVFSNYDDKIVIEKIIKRLP